MFFIQEAKDGVPRETLVTFFCTTKFPKESMIKTSDSCMDENAHENPRNIHYNFFFKNPIALLSYMGKDTSLVEVV